MASDGEHFVWPRPNHHLLAAAGSSLRTCFHAWERFPEAREGESAWSSRHQRPNPSLRRLRIFRKSRPFSGHWLNYSPVWYKIIRSNNGHCFERVTLSHNPRSERYFYFLNKCLFCRTKTVKCRSALRSGTAPRPRDIWLAESPGLSQYSLRTEHYRLEGMSQELAHHQRRISGGHTWDDWQLMEKKLKMHRKTHPLSETRKFRWRWMAYGRGFIPSAIAHERRTPLWRWWVSVSLGLECYGRSEHSSRQCWTNAVHDESRPSRVQGQSLFDSRVVVVDQESRTSSEASSLL